MKPTRREFMKKSIAAVGFASTFAISGTQASGRILGANDRVRMCIAGFSAHGGDFQQIFSGMRDVEIAWLYDESRRNLDRQAAIAEVICPQRLHLQEFYHSVFHLEFKIVYLVQQSRSADLQFLSKPRTC